MARIEVREIDWVNRRLKTNDNRSLPISDMFTEHGQSTQDYTAAVLCIAGRSGEWLSLKLGDYRRNALQ